MYMIFLSFIQVIKYTAVVNANLLSFSLAIETNEPEDRMLSWAGELHCLDYKG